MSLVTTPSASSPASAPQTAAIRLLLPDPTGPPTPIRRARSTGKQTLPLFEMAGRGQLDRDRRRAGQRTVVERDPARGGGERRREVREPAGRHRGVERKQLERGRGDRRRVVV